MLGHGMMMAAGGGGVSYKDLILADGANHFWPMDETSGTTAADLIGTANGTYVGSPLLAQQGIAGLKAISLNGSSQCLGNNNDIVTNTNFSYELWVKTSSVNGVIFGATNTGMLSSPSLYDKTCYFSSGPGVTFGVYDGVVRKATYSKNIADSSWHHIVSSMGTNSCTLFIDGAPVATLGYVSGAGGGKPSFGACNVYGWPGATGSYMSGLISAPASYPFAMSQAMALAHYNAGK